MKPTLLCLVCACLLSACAPPDHWAANCALEPAASGLPARQIYSVGVSGPLSRQTPAVDQAPPRIP